MKRVLVTGASAGIGQAIAQSLIAAGHEVWGTSRRQDSLPKSDRFHPVTMDLRDIDAVERAFADVWQQAGSLDVVINNAGSGHFGPAESLALPEIADQFQVVFFAHVRLLQLALAAMRTRGSGLIINVTSLAALLPVPFMAAYNAAKSAMASFTMSMQLEAAHSGIHLVDLQPGDICTSFNDAVRNDPGAPEYRDGLAKTWKTVDHNMKSAPKPDLVARAVLKLIDQKNPPPLVTVGDTFQTKIAPLIFRFLPQSVRIWGIKRYYGI